MPAVNLSKIPDHTHHLSLDPQVSLLDDNGLHPLDGGPKFHITFPLVIFFNGCLIVDELVKSQN